MSEHIFKAVYSNPDVVYLCAETLNLVAIVRMGLEPSPEDLDRASKAIAAVLTYHN